MHACQREAWQEHTVTWSTEANFGIPLCKCRLKRLKHLAVAVCWQACFAAQLLHCLLVSCELPFRRVDQVLHQFGLGQVSAGPAMSAISIKHNSCDWACTATLFGLRQHFGGA